MAGNGRLTLGAENGPLGQQPARTTTDSANNLNELKVAFSPRELQTRTQPRGFPGGAVVENLPANAGDTGSSPGLGRSHMPRSD